MEINTDVNVVPKRHTITFATMCKDEAHCIRDTLESVYKYIDNWVVCDTGSTDDTIKVVTDFFTEKGIPGEVFIDEWVSFDVNKTKLFERCYGRSDFILHLDSDDVLVGDFNFQTVDGTKDTYYLMTKKGNTSYKCLVIFTNRKKWRFVGVAHTTIHIIGENYKASTELVSDDFYLLCRDTGARSADPRKYHKDAEKLQKQFWDTLYNDPDGLNNRSVFYTAQSYMDAGELDESLKWLCLYIKLQNTWIEEVYECYLRIGQILMAKGKPYQEIKNQIMKANTIFPDRAEGYYILGKHANDLRMSEEGYNMLKIAKDLRYDQATSKYCLFVRKNCYGKYCYDEYSVSCYWTGRYQEGKEYLEKVLDDPEFSHHKSRFLDNMNHFNNKINESINALEEMAKP
jgi:glycosyltransferase involved in cell wall biosynthesis